MKGLIVSLILLAQATAMAGLGSGASMDGSHVSLYLKASDALAVALQDALVKSPAIKDLGGNIYVPKGVVFGNDILVMDQQTPGAFSLSLFVKIQDSTMATENNFVRVSGTGASKALYDILKSSTSSHVVKGAESVTIFANGSNFADSNVHCTLAFSDASYAHCSIHLK